MSKKYTELTPQDLYRIIRSQNQLIQDLASHGESLARGYDVGPMLFRSIQDKAELLLQDVTDDYGRHRR